MDFKQLEMFVAVVEEGNFNRAADRVFRTQSAVSIALLKLEEEIGAPLLDRSIRNRYILTDAGELLLGYARRLLSLRDEAESALTAIQTVNSGRIRVGVCEEDTLCLFPKLLLSFRKLYPGIRVEITQRAAGDLLHSLRARHLDFALLSFLPAERGFETSVIVRDEAVLILCPQQPLARRQSVHIRDLEAESFIVHHVRSRLHEELVAAFKQYHTSLNAIVEIDDIEAVKRLVMDGLGVAVVPFACVQDEVMRGELAVVLISGFHHERTLRLIYCRIHSDAMEAFLQVAASLAKDYSTLGGGIGGSRAWPGDMVTTGVRERKGTTM